MVTQATRMTIVLVPQCQSRPQTKRLFTSEKLETLRLTYIRLRIKDIPKLHQVNRQQSTNTTWQTPIQMFIIHQQAVFQFIHTIPAFQLDIPDQHTRIFTRKKSATRKTLCTVHLVVVHHTIDIHRMIIRAMHCHHIKDIRMIRHPPRRTSISAIHHQQPEIFMDIQTIDNPSWHHFQLMVLTVAKLTGILQRDSTICWLLWVTWVPYDNKISSFPPPLRLIEFIISLYQQNGREEPYTPRKEVNTSLATGKAVAIVEPKVPTKNLAGPPVYYPPGHELFAKNEQSAAAWRAQVKLFQIRNSSVEIFENKKKIFYESRAVTQMVVESTNTKLKVNRKALVKAEEQWYQFACHYVVPCHVLLCKRKAFAPKIFWFFFSLNFCLHCATSLPLNPEQIIFICNILCFPIL